MTTEQYSIGYDEGYQAGWNAAMDAKPAQQEPVIAQNGDTLEIETILYTSPQPAQQDIPDLIAGALGVSRGTAYDMMREALTAQQEPVAFIDMREWPPIRWRDGMLRKDIDQFDGQGLYTSPPAQQEPLTDDEIAKEVEAELTHYWNGEYIDTTGARDQLTAFARAIEAKLKERNT